MEEKIQALAEMIKGSMSGGKRNYSIKILNQLITTVNQQEQVIKNFKARKVGIGIDNYDTFIERVSCLIIILGFSPTDMMNYNDIALRFILDNRHSFKKPITAEYVNSLHELYTYYEWSRGFKPEKLKDLADAYTEIEDNR